MSVKKRLHQLVDELSEAEAKNALRYIVSRHMHEDLPGDIIDEWGNLSAMARASTAETMRRLDEEEREAFGETLADAWGWDSPTHVTRPATPRSASRSPSRPRRA
jgi:ATP-dependent Clp protease ATP-binding subunit ClpA